MTIWPMKRALSGVALLCVICACAAPGDSHVAIPRTLAEELAAARLEPAVKPPATPAQARDEHADAPTGHVDPISVPPSTPTTLAQAYATRVAPVAPPPAQRGDAPAPAGHSILFALHLASYRSSDAARRGWGLLRSDAPDVLQELSARTELVNLGGERGDYLRLKAGPLASRLEAAARCETLAAEGLFCRAVSFAGEDLAN